MLEKTGFFLDIVLGSRVIWGAKISRDVCGSFFSGKQRQNSSENATCEDKMQEVK